MSVSKSLTAMEIIEKSQRVLLKTLDDFVGTEDVSESEHKKHLDHKDVSSIIGLTRALNDSALATLKLDQRDREIDDASQIARDMIEIHRSAPQLIRGTTIEGEVVRGTIPTPDKSRLPKVTLLPGQLGSSVPDINLDTFMTSDQDSD